MIKIEGHSVETIEGRNGWYLDCDGEPWFFADGEPICCFDSKGVAYNSLVSKVFEPFTRLTGRVIITND